MLALDPKDDYPDSADRITLEQYQQGIRPHVLTAELPKPSAQLRAWIAASPVRSLSPNARVLAIARVETYVQRSGGGVQRYVRAPTARELGLWTLSVSGIDGPYDVVVLPQHVSVRSLAVGDDRRLQLSLELGEAILGGFGVASRVEIATSIAALRKFPRVQDQLAKPDQTLDVLAAVLRDGGAQGAQLSQRARVADAKDARRKKAEAAERARPRPTARDFRVLVDAALAKLRPALIADLQKRVFTYAFPEGTRELAFEVFWDQLDRLPIVGYLMDDDNGQIQIKGKRGARVLAPNLEILPKVKRVLSKRALAPFVDVDVANAPIVLRWFVDAWKAAGGGTRFPLRASIAYHDGGRVTKLPNAARRR